LQGNGLTLAEQECCQHTPCAIFKSVVILYLMKQYVIDELRLSDHQKIKAWLDEHFSGSGVQDIYWIPIEPECLTNIQMEHKSCQPHYFSVSLEEKRLACELLVRTHNKIRCDCMGYADELQRERIIRFADSLLETLGIQI
jgi:hypothetical protein